MDIDIVGYFNDIKQYLSSLFNKREETKNLPILTQPKEQPAQQSEESAKKDNKNHKDINEPAKGFQNPIKVEYHNSGNFSPDSPTDKRHIDGHHGVDLRAPGGTPVYPIADGVVDSVATGTPKGGNSINIVHPGGIRTYYAHLHSINVAKGDKVTKSTIIGTVGDSGNAKGTWPHLHFQIWDNGVLKNPKNYISVPKYSDPPKNEQKWLLSVQDKNVQNKNLTPSKKKAELFNKINKFSYITRTSNHD